MKGKKIGVQATNEAVWNAFLKANKIDAGSITKVPVQFDPTPLTTGEVDGWFSFVTNEPNDLKYNKHFDTVTFLSKGDLQQFANGSFVIDDENMRHLAYGFLDGGLCSLHITSRNSRQLDDKLGAAVPL